MKEQSKRELIHNRLNNKHPKAVKKAKRLFGLKYPKLLLLIIFIGLAYIIFRNPLIANSIKGLEHFSYFGIFIAGIFLAFGFSAPFAVGFLIVANPSNILLASLIAGLGAAMGDMLIFKTIKITFLNEIEELEETKTMHFIRNTAKNHLPTSIRHYILYVFAGIFIATPLPDEIGVSFLAGLTTVNPKALAVISFILHTSMVYLILLASV